MIFFSRALDAMIYRMKTKNIFLVGPMGAGKTTIGRQLAKKVRFVFYDSDHEVERLTGVSVSTIFEYEGEEGFRKREIDVIAKLTQLDNIILSTGGGAVLSTENRKSFSSRGNVVYLRASIDTQLRRTSQRKGTRPLLDTQNPLEKIIEFDKIRAPLYEEVAHYIYDTDKEEPQEIIDHICHTLFK